MRIAVVAPGYRATADDPFVGYWAERIAGLAEQHDVVVFALRYPATRAEYRLDGATIVPLGHGNVRLRRSPPMWRDAVAAIVRHHQRQPFDVLHALQAHEPGFVAAMAGIRIGRPLAVQLVGGELTWLPVQRYGSQGVPIERVQVRITLARAAAVTVGATVMAKNVRAAIGGDDRRVAWAPYGVDTSRFLPTPWPTFPRVVHVANLNAVKGQPRLLEAFALAAADERAARLDIVGDGPELVGLRRLAVALGVADKLRWWGQIPNIVMPHVYAGAVAFSLSSWHEGQGVVFLEAAACGLPIAATRVGAAMDLPPAGTHLVAPGDVAGLAAALQAAWSPGPERAAAREALRHAAETDYRLDRCNERLAAVLARVVAEQ